MSTKDIKNIIPKIQNIQHKRHLSNDKAKFPSLNLNSKPIRLNPGERGIQSHRAESQSPNDSLNLNLIDIVDRVNLEHKHTKHQSANFTSGFKEKIDNLNLNFYLETEKYMNKSIGENKCIGNLFSILFQELNVYNDEISKLSSELESKNDKGNNLLIHSMEFSTKNKLIQSLKDSKQKLEERLSNELEKNNNLLIEINKLRKENELYKKENDSYKHMIERNKSAKKIYYPQTSSELTKAESNQVSNDLNESKGKKFGDSFYLTETNNLFNTFGEEKFKNFKKKSKPQLCISDLNEDFKNASCVNNINKANNPSLYDSTVFSSSGVNKTFRTARTNISQLKKAKIFLTKEKPTRITKERYPENEPKIYKP